MEENKDLIVDGMIQYHHKNMPRFTEEEVINYGKGKDLYAWHIKKLEIFDELKSLSDFYKATLYATGEVIKEYEKRTNDFSYKLQRPPQSWQYVYVEGERR